MLKNGTGPVPRTFDQCTYDGSRLLFRGPRRALDGAFVACLGGTETFGKFIDHPFPDLLEEKTGVTCVNFGWPNAGIDVFAGDRALLDCASRSQLCILQVPCAINMSNMYYRVHPRRNDRFLQATEAMRTLFDEVDFTEFSFTRHMLGRLQALSPEKFAYIREELASVWVAGMQGLIGRIDAPVVLLWLSARAPERAADRPDLRADPALVNREMLDALRPMAHRLVELSLGEAARGADPGRSRAAQDRRAAHQVLGPEAHRQAAEALSAVVEEIVQP